MFPDFSAVRVAHLLLLLCTCYFAYIMFFVVCVCFPCLVFVPRSQSFIFLDYSFKDYLHLFYHNEHEVKEISDTKLYDQCDDFDLPIVNFRVLSGNIPTSPVYSVYISQLIFYCIACTRALFV